MDLVRVPERLYPVGRLDRDTEGLLLLTNDGDVANRVMHPRYELAKEYHVLTPSRPSEPTFRRVREGIVVQGRRVIPEEFRILRETRDGLVLTIVIHEGMHHVVRRLMEAVGIPVSGLTRVRIGPLTLSGLPTGGWRDLTPGERSTLFEALHLECDPASAPPSWRASRQRPDARQGAGPTSRDQNDLARSPAPARTPQPPRQPANSQPAGARRPEPGSPPPPERQRATPRRGEQSKRRPPAPLTAALQNHDHRRAHRSATDAQPGPRSRETGDGNTPADGHDARRSDRLGPRSGIGQGEERSPNASNWDHTGHHVSRAPRKGKRRRGEPPAPSAQPGRSARPPASGRIRKPRPDEPRSRPNDGSDRDSGRGRPLAANRAPRGPDDASSDGNTRLGDKTGRSKRRRPDRDERHVDREP